MGGGKERKMNNGSATANQVRERGKELKYKLLKIESAMKKYYSQNLSSHRSVVYLGLPGIE
jgi:hypothetical protein